MRRKNSDGMGKKKRTIVDPNQMSLLDYIRPAEAHLGPGSYNIEVALKEEASLALRKSPLSRYEVAAKMSEMLGAEVTKTMLDNRTAESKENQLWPALWLAPFSIVTGHYGQLKTINKLAKVPIADSEKLLDMEIEQRQRSIEEEKKELDDLLKLKQFLNGQSPRR